MNILGINQIPGMLSWMHDSAAALVQDGVIIASAEEERFNRVRHHRGYPRHAIEYCLKTGGITMKDVDYIALAYNPYAFLKRPNLHWQSLARNVFNIGACIAYGKQIQKETNAQVVYVPHHLSHAASAYYCSGYDKANILTVDGSGETESFAFFVGEHGSIKRVWDIPLASFMSAGKWRSIGLIYTSVTSLLNLGVNAEGKTMGLASYGEPTFDFSEILHITTHTNYKIDRRKLLSLYGHMQKKDKTPLTQEDKNLAASLQKALEQSIVHLAKEAYAYTGIKNFCLAGGVTLNCNTNSEILKQDFCDALFVQPAANDGGIALGAALEVAAQQKEVSAQTKIINAYYGPEYTNEEIEKLLQGAKVKYRKAEDIATETAELITQGNIVAWFQGRMEMGPRALGNRSILADPTIHGMDDKINTEVKHREVWRPFAPSVTHEAAATYFQGIEDNQESPFMLHTFYVKEAYAHTFPAITHVDGSSRIQTVRPEQNKRYYDLLKAMEKKNGHPIVLNTSFNDKGEPIVCSPYDALRCFFATGIDALAIGDFILEKKNQ